MDFKTVKNGYSKEQIENYIDTVATEYRKMQDEYKELLESSKGLTASLKEARNRSERQRSVYESRIKNLESQIANLKLRLETAETGSVINHHANVDAIAKALVDAEVLAKQIVESAHQEAARINFAAKDELDKITIAKKQIYDEIENVQGLLDIFRKQEV